MRDDVHPLPLWMAGGLLLHNVAASVAAVQPDGWDLCTGERRAGRLGADKLIAFVRALRTAD